MLRGANHAPQEFEDALDGLTGVRAGCAVALGFVPHAGDGEELVLLVETTADAGPDLADRIRAAVAERSGIRPHTVQLLAPGTLPRTSSGKLRRSEALRRWTTGNLHPPARVNAVRLDGGDAQVGARPGAHPPSRARAGDVSMPTVDVAVVGGGPAGLALAAMAARQGLSVLLLERATLPHDKACGEGVMPAGLGVLERLGVLDRIPAADAGPIRGVRYVQEDGSMLEGALPGPGGLGVRRTALSAVLLEAAREAGVAVRDRTTLRAHLRTPAAMLLQTDGEEIAARVLVAADGLHSPLRRAEGLELPVHGPRRFGLRQHFLRAPWTDRVEVHLSRSAEAYVTPCGPARVGVAFLWSDGQLDVRPSVESLLGRFPVLAGRLGEAAARLRASGRGPVSPARAPPRGHPLRAAR